ALFALAYRTTLTAGARDQAGYAVPADFVLREDPAKLVSPLVLPRPRSARPLPVLRLSGSVAGRAVTLLGVPARALDATGGWRDDFSSDLLASVARSAAAQRGDARDCLPPPPA